MIYEPMPSMEEIEAELFSLAEQRLSNYPGAFKRFKNEPLGRSIIHSWSFKLLSLGLNALAFHTAEARQSRLLQIIDEWAKDRLKPIAPLHLSPDCEHIAADIPEKNPPLVQKIKRHKLRKNTIDVPIKKAIQLAGSTDVSAVFLELRDLALAGERPFTGLVENGGLCYQKDDGTTINKHGKPHALTKDALGKRLKNHTL
jgi:hypothetical protein